MIMQPQYAWVQLHTISRLMGHKLMHLLARLKH
jgi:hypothetical protein